VDTPATAGRISAVEIIWATTFPKMMFFHDHVLTLLRSLKNQKLRASKIEHSGV
jgi:hypothetical protein